MYRHDWFAWHRNYRTDDWFLSLPDEQKWAWVAFLSWANEFSWRPPKCSIQVLSRNVWCDERYLSLLLVTAVTNGKIIDEGDHWFVKNGDKYAASQPMSNAERQAKHRENKERVTESNERNESVTSVTAPVYTGTVTKTKTRQESSPPLPPRNGKVSETMAKAVDSIVRSAQHERPQRPKSFAETYAEKFGSILNIPRYADKTQMRENDNYVNLRGMCSTIMILSDSQCNPDGNCDVLNRIYGEIEEARASPKTKNLTAIGISKIKNAKNLLREKSNEEKSKA